MLNLGCGNRFHSSWVNLDISPRHPSVLQCDVVRGIPFGDDHFDVVYHSHMLEHIRRRDVQPFLQECRRVLKPGGILRVATPDLERLCELYLDRVRGATTADALAASDHAWLVLEMFDQVARERSGGDMIAYLRQDPLPNQSFVLERIGEEGREILRSIRRDKVPLQRVSARHGFASRVVRGIGRRVKRVLPATREALIKSWYGHDALHALEIGKFRLSGEVHHWLYDRVSLSRVLQDAGFCEPVARRANESAIDGWPAFHLDTTATGDVIKPDSFFMEATKPRL